MAATLNETPSSNRLHIGIFGKTNSGKSAFINAFTKQEVSIVADVAGTTTDPVYKAMEVHPLGPCIIIDTAGFDDKTELGERRVEKTRLAAEKTELAVILFAGESVNHDLQGTSEIVFDLTEELRWYHFFKEKKTPVLLVVNKADIREDSEALLAQIKKETGEEALLVSAKTGEGMDAVREALIRKIPENYGNQMITAELVGEEDLVLLVMPQDIQAPKGRLILPQVQTLRELLDKKCLVMSVTTDKLTKALATLVHPPKLIITDSQVFGYVYEHKPAESMLTSFSVLFAAYKGDLPYYVEGAKQIDALKPDSRVLIAECCTHAPLAEDIGREKIPKMLRKRFGETLSVDIVSGTDFPQDLSGYDLIIQCGACMFNRKYVMSRIDRAREQQTPMTNYGVTIAHLTGILDKITMP
ncbi:MAG: [FeFe] hydrogenase H-cluster maturation GTPase HydF [Clostridiales bacterium]|nr:[FeFe] hydrogenase H-cluster maturation GTPase HydF [Roseburia sp.]MDD7637161.1 [FeFe] hydrogenase H-cluster maturation GTPase HydF [Clostridiales bacterium]MDY4114088.1 [FeFe] hydrogenase H-cluster maturation GTPase HydF [Roseburia sp.]